jgi:hypothetical protein
VLDVVNLSARTSPEFAEIRSTPDRVVTAEWLAVEPMHSAATSKAKTQWARHVIGRFAGVGFAIAISKGFMPHRPTADADLFQCHEIYSYANGPQLSRFHPTSGD